MRQRLHDKIEFLKQNRSEKEGTKQKKHNIKREAPKGKKSAPVEDKRPKLDEAESKEEVKQEAPVVSTPSVNDVISKYTLIFCIQCSIQFGKIRGTEEVDTSLRPKVKKDIHQLLKKAQKKQEYIKKLESTESGKVRVNDMIDG